MKKQVLAAAVALGLAGGAQAQGWDVSGYVQGNLGWANASTPKAVKAIRDGNDWAKNSSHRSSPGYKFLVGLQLNPYVALEAQYVDFGKAKFKSKDTDVPDYYFENKTDFATSGLGFNLVGTYPVTERFTVFAKTGMHHLKTKAKWKEFAPYDENHHLNASKSFRRWSPSYGAGASYEFLENLAVVAEYERYQGIASNKKWYAGNEDSGVTKMRYNMDFLSVGLRYKF